MSLLLSRLAWHAGRAFQLRKRDYVFTYLALSIVTAAIVFGDHLAH